MKLVLVTYGGRKNTLQCLFPLIVKYKKYIHEYRLYVITKIKEDIDYMQKFYEENKDFVNIIYTDLDKYDREEIWGNLWSELLNDDTVYIRLDDDIVYIDESLFTDFVDYRIKNRNAPLLFPVIINNPYISWVLQENNVIQTKLKSSIGTTWKYAIDRVKQYIYMNKHRKIRIGDIIPDNQILCPVAWGNLEYCYDLHSQFIDAVHNNISKFYIDNKILTTPEYICINACSWIGSDMKQIINNYGNIYYEEPWLTIYLPIWSSKYNELYGKCVVSHYAYYKQRELGLDKTDILEKYKNI
jgi:hypothetical protein